ncbi:MAG: hypothetical protein IKM18_08480 [Clostridia bacterium]|nr:hypothetical protein [Clostridia bacterium]
MKLNLNDFSLSIDFKIGAITSLRIRDCERLAAQLPLFRIRLRDENGGTVIVTAFDANSCEETDEGALYDDFSSADISAYVTLTDENGEAAWRIAVTPKSDRYFVEWVEFPLITLPPLEANNRNGNGGKILFPYNEGVLVSDIRLRKYSKAEYPSQGNYSVFPNMICSQMLAYLWEDAGFYVGAHDERRGVKEIDFIEEQDGVALSFRLFCGTDFGERFETDYPIIFSAIEGKWESAAERYRKWFESALPKGIKKISENCELPDWYADAPLVVSYPIRGIHDMDEMNPNKLYPYTNALPLLDEIKKECDSRLLVLLMHWEGTAPWAPPYVWPPYGGTENFNEFLSELHRKGDLLGVYCSGFGYTLQSNLIDDYNKEAEYADQGLWRGMCVGPDGKIAISQICQGQRIGYDICPASEIGKNLLKEAYSPVLESELDYVQILDQNHGGGQYFCYGRNHGHAPSPGTWMTENMQNMLSEWNHLASKTLLGCESAAAEPFIGNLLFSDNRYELNYEFGVAVPLYAYLYHEYVRNFMGNQVSCPFCSEEDTLRYRLAYSFCAGDCMTLVLTPEGNLMSNWGTRDFSHFPDKEKAFRLIANLTRFYKNVAKPYLFAGRMLPLPNIESPNVSFTIKNSERTVTLPAILSSAWETRDGKRALILVNPSDIEAHCQINGIQVTVPPLDAITHPL